MRLFTTMGLKNKFKFTNSIQIIPVYGIHPIAMDILYKELIADNDIIEINNTNKTTSLGWWNVFVTLENFKSQMKWFQHNIGEIHNKYCKEVVDKIPTNYDPKV